MSIEKVTYTARAKAMGGQVGNQMLGQSCMEFILKSLDEDILKIELNRPQSASRENMCGADAAVTEGRHAGSSWRRENWDAVASPS